ncbi:MAG: STAS domain-containing protein [Chitinispirillales bacterium]|nr:STAS domain-containing protein [Chitinispirillales bacterium]
MDINKTQNGDKTVFVLSGRLDTITAPKLEAVLIPEFDTAMDVELDFAGLAYVSSAGLRVLMKGLNTADAKGASMSVSNASEEIMEVFEMTGFSDILTIV